MPRKSTKQTLAEQQDGRAPFLFDEDDLPLRAEVVQAVREQRYKHTGARLLENEERALRLVELLMMRWGTKRIANELRISKHSVKAAREALVARGEMAPYKERIVAKMEEIVEVGLDNYLQALENGTVPAAQIPVGVGIISDKRALALGEATVISQSQTGANQGKELTVEALNGYLEKLRRVGSSDVASIEEGDKHQ